MVVLENEEDRIIDVRASSLFEVGAQLGLHYKTRIEQGSTLFDLVPLLYKLPNALLVLKVKTFQAVLWWSARHCV